MDRTFLLIGAIAGLLAVAFGAFGAHALRSRLSPDMLAVFETAVRYQMYHALALLAVALAVGRIGDAPLLIWAGWAFVDAANGQRDREKRQGVIHLITHGRFK